MQHLYVSKYRPVLAKKYAEKRADALTLTITLALGAFLIGYYVIHATSFINHAF